MAMRAKVTTAEEPPWFEWIIVSRWGVAGEHFSIGRTRVPALSTETAPINLTPSKTALARLLPLPPALGAATFLFVQRRPASLSVAGDFAPAQGYVRLDGLGEGSRLEAEGSCVACSPRRAWRVEAERTAWIGEFIEAPGGQTDVTKGA